MDFPISLSSPFLRVIDFARAAGDGGSRDLSFWVDESAVWTQSVGLGIQRLSPLAYIAAAIAHGIEVELRQPIGASQLALASAIWTPGDDRYNPPH